MAILEYTELSGKKISRGHNVNVAALPAKRVVGYASNAASQDAIDAVSVTGLAKLAGITLSAIASGETGDLAAEDGIVVPVEKTAAIITRGDKLTVELATGKVLTAAPGVGVNAEIIGSAENTVDAAAAHVMCRIHRFTMQGA